MAINAAHVVTNYVPVRVLIQLATLFVVAATIVVIAIIAVALAFFVAVAVPVVVVVVVMFTSRVNVIKLFTAISYDFS
jgi:hypothetical protein